MAVAVTIGTIQQRRFGTGFKTEWTVAGDATARTITLPLYNSGVFNCTVNWGDGTANSVITSYNDADRVHTYAINGTYTVEIKGKCPSWSFNNAGDKLKITKIINWGEQYIFDGFTSYWTAGFHGCANITGDLTFPSWTNTIPGAAFLDCTGYNGTCTIPSNIVSFGNSACRGLSNITGDLVFPDTVTSVGEWSWLGCGFTGGTLTLSNNMTNIPQQAFAYCGFSTLVFGSSIQSLIWRAFYATPFTGNLTIPDTVTYIETEVFNSTLFSGTLTFGSGLTTVAENAFTNLDFTSIVSNSSNFEISDYVVYDVGTAGVVKALCSAKGYSGTLTLRNDTTRIASNCFTNNTLRTGSLTIPNTVTTLGNWAFQNCTGFTGGLTLSSTLISISNSFYNCSGLSGALTIPATVTSISSNAFRSCGGFTSVTFDCTSFTGYDWDTFYGMWGVTEINLPANYSGGWLQFNYMSNSFTAASMNQSIINITDGTKTVTLAATNKARLLAAYPNAETDANARGITIA